MIKHLVSVVIPTRNRPTLLLRAINTALGQTYPHVEIVVVIDGPDPETLAALEELKQETSRVQVIALAESVGGSEARNTGVRLAKGEWIALLDDDDEWYAEKLERQIAAARTLVNPYVILSSRYLERSIQESRVQPRRLPGEREPVDNYLCCPRGLLTGGEVLQTSTLVAPRSLFLSVPFVPGLRRGQDFMWMIQASALGDATLHVVPEVLSIFNSEGYTDNHRVSSKPQWNSFYECVRENRRYFRKQAYSYCIATRILTDAIKSGEPFSIRMRLIGESLRNGASIKCLLLFLYICFIPSHTRGRLGDGLRAISPRANTGRSQVGSA